MWWIMMFTVASLYFFSFSEFRLFLQWQDNDWSSKNSCITLTGCQVLPEQQLWGVAEMSTHTKPDGPYGMVTSKFDLFLWTLTKSGHPICSEVIFLLSLISRLSAMISIMEISSDTHLYQWSYRPNHCKILSVLQRIGIISWYCRSYNKSLVRIREGA